ncbi:MAG: hypothetical protein ACFB10_23825 [Salibacteraceae bacterium]
MKLWTTTFDTKVYISNYGATEYFEFSNPQYTTLGNHLKIDGLEHAFTGDQKGTPLERSYNFIYDKAVFLPGSKLNYQDYTIEKESDTLIQNYPCRLVQFYDREKEMHGEVALWKNIPLWGALYSGETVWESMELIELDVKSDIPEEKTRLME